MTTKVTFAPIAIFVLTLFCTPSFAQPSARRAASTTPQTTSTPQERVSQATLPPDANSTSSVANEIELLRKSLQTLNARLREISEKLLASNANQSGSSNDKQNRISINLELLTRAEQRAEVLRKQLLELIEKETLLRSRLVQIEEEARPESIERAANLVGTTRTAELRDVRRRVLENERKGFESLLTQTAQSRQRLDEDVRQADTLVSKLRQRLLPLIEKEIEKIAPN